MECWEGTYFYSEHNRDDLYSHGAAGLAKQFEQRVGKIVTATAVG